MRMFACVGWSVRDRETIGGAYGFEVAVDDAHRMEILQPVRCFRELQECVRIRGSE